jgi:hypothetical protein
MSSYRGVVQENTIILEEGVHLPNGTAVVVITSSSAQEEGEITSEELNERRGLVTRMKAFGQKLTGKTVDLSDAVLEAKDELEDRA